MKRAIIALCAAALLAGCTTRTEYGPCIGVLETGDPSLRYNLSAWNLVLAFIFSETIVVPVVVLIESTRCPVGQKVSP